MKYLVTLLMLLTPIAHAGPPPGGYPKQVPFMLFCHKDEALMLKAIERSFNEYILQRVRQVVGFYTLPETRMTAASVWLVHWEEKPASYLMAKT